MKYNVLWIDDNPSEEFMNCAFDDYDLNIINKVCYDDGIEWLRTHQDECWAVIMDVNCKTKNTDAENASVRAFVEGHKKVEKLCSEPLIPWFFYTAGDYDGVDGLNMAISDEERWWDDRKYYDKPGDWDILLNKIKEAIKRLPDYEAINKYKDIFIKFPEISDRLRKILVILEDGETRNADVYNAIRKALEEGVIPYLYDHGLLLKEVQQINQVGYFLKTVSLEDPILVPKFISFGWSVLSEIIQNGSHAKNRKHQDNSTNLVVDELTRRGKMPYLIRSTVFTFLNFLTWASLLPQTDEEIDNLRRKIETFNINIGDALKKN